MVMRPHSRTLRPFSNDLAVPPVPPDSPFVPCLRPRPTLQPSLFVDDGDDPDFRLPGWQAGINTRGSQADPHASGAVARDPTQDPTPMYASPPPLFAAETWVVWVMWARDIPCLPQHGCTSVEKKKGGAHSRILLSSTFVVIATLIRPHRAHVGHVCSHVARCLPFCWLFPQKSPRDVWHGGAGRLGGIPPSTIATNPAVALLNTTVILINKHLHLCILLCEPGRVLRQAVRLKTRAPALREALVLPFSVKWRPTLLII